MENHRILISREEEGGDFLVLNLTTANAYRFVYLPDKNGFDVFEHFGNNASEDFTPGGEGDLRMKDIAAFCLGVVEGKIKPTEQGEMVSSCNPLEEMTALLDSLNINRSIH